MAHNDSLNIKNSSYKLFKMLGNIKNRFSATLKLYIKKLSHDLNAPFLVSNYFHEIFKIYLTFFLNIIFKLLYNQGLDYESCQINYKGS